MNRIFSVLVFYFLTGFSFSQEVSAPETFHLYVAQEIFPKTDRVQEFYWQGQRYWLKKVSEDKISWGTKWGRQLGAFLIPINFLKTTPLQEDNLLNFEKKRLQECERLKAQCPRIVDFDRNWIVLSDGGISCEVYLKNLPREQKVSFVQHLIRLIFENHQKGFFHGRCAVRDMLISSEGRITFFDIEEDPLKVMEQSEARAREIFFFLISVYGKLDHHQRQELAKWLNKELAPDIKKVLLVLKKYHFVFKVLNHFKSCLGKDGNRFLRTSLFLIENLAVYKS